MNLEHKGQIQVKLIGHFSVSDSDGSSICPKGLKTAGVLAYLIFNLGKEITRERLIDLFWSDRGTKQGQDSLRQSLHAIRLVFGHHAEYIMSVSRRTIVIHPEYVNIDLWQADGTISANLSGIFLENLNSTSPVFDDWVMVTRRDLINRQISAEERRLAALDININSEEALKHTKTIITLDPLNEPVARTAMKIYALQGRLGHARRAFEQLSENLRADGLEVSVETRNALKALSDGRSLAEDPTPTNPRLDMLIADRGIPTIEAEFIDPTLTSPIQAQIISDFSDRLITRMVQMPEIRVHSQQGKSDQGQYRLIVSSGQTHSGVRVSLRLVAPNSQFIWSERAELGEDPSDSRILIAVDRLVMQLLPALEEHIFYNIKGEPTTAYGNFLFSKRIFSTAPSEDYIENALSYLRRAVQVDPGFLPAYSHLIMYYNTGMFMSQPGADHSDLRKTALELSQKLLFLNSKHANGHICMAWCLMWRSKFDAAERSLRRAMDLSPYDPHRLNIIGTALVYLGHHDEAKTYYEMAQNRLHHDFDFQRTDYGELYFLKREYPQALSWMEIPEARTPYKTLFFRAMVQAQLGRMDEARKDVDAFVEDIRLRWKGREPFRPEDGFQWYSDLLPLRTRRDRETLADGMAKLQIPITVRGKT